MMARTFEHGFHLVDRCRQDLPALARLYPQDSAMRAALEELLEATRKVDDLLRRANPPAPAGLPQPGPARTGREDTRAQAHPANP